MSPRPWPVGGGEGSEGPGGGAGTGQEQFLRAQCPSLARLIVTMTPLLAPGILFRLRMLLFPNSS